MAEVFLAEEAVDGLAPRRVALKRVLPHLRDDPMMTGMLRDEARLGARVAHPNLVETLAWGEVDDEPFIVLEYVEGVDLATLHSTLGNLGQRFSVADALHIAMELCQGLHHLHTLRGENGERLGVVHRDVTPPNVLLSVHGAVKLCDFGFVKSKRQRTRTDPGVIKGKFSYLSPEVARGEVADPRADVFAVGVLLWEMLAMRRLFHGKTDYETVKMIQDARPQPLSPLHPDVDDVLETTVQRALAADREERFPTAEALGQSLAAYADWQELSADLGPLGALVQPPEATPVSGIRFTGPS